MLLSLIGTLFTSILSGGATGLFGIAIQRHFDLKNKVLDIEADKARMGHEIDLRRIDADIMAREADAKIQVADIDATSREAVADAQAFSASFQEPKAYSSEMTVSKNQGWLLVILDFIRGIVRPGLTVYLCVITTLVYTQAYNLLKTEGVAMDISAAMRLIEMVVGTILYLTTTCVLWWFGTRNKQKPPKIRAD